MKNISIKLKIAMLNTLLMTLIVSLVLVFMMLISDKLIDLNVKKQLQDVVEYNAEKIVYEDGAIWLDDLELYKKEVYTYVYTQNGNLIKSYKSDVPEINGVLSDKQLSNQTIYSEEYYIYDMYIENDDSEDLWIRGITLATDESQVASTVVRIAFITVPIFILISAIGSYKISKKGFAPIEKIVDTAIKIKHSENLSHRINIEKGSDEIHNLANIFDEMFETIEKAFEIEKQFSSDVSHELRTPTSVILAQCEYALDENISDEEKQKTFEVIKRQGLKMRKLITNLLNLIRLDQGDEKIDIRDTNLSQLVEIVCQEHEMIRTNNISLKYDIEQGIYEKIDKDLMITMISNLISNAYKYGKEDGNIFVRLYKKENGVNIEIEDNGIGIDPNHVDKIWNRFYQVDSSRSNQNGSMGLGLSMVLKIAKVHRAKIELETNLGKGSKFIIIFNKK